jgi:hypothetical protein
MSSQFDNGFNKDRSREEFLADLVREVYIEKENAKKYGISVECQDLNFISAETIISLKSMGLKIKDIREVR